MRREQQLAYDQVAQLVGTWPVGGYKYYVDLVEKFGESSTTEFNVVFSKPIPTCPVPQQTANVRVMAVKSSDALELTYTIERALQRHPASALLTEKQIDWVICRKQATNTLAKNFVLTGELPKPEKFIPGQYSAAAGLEKAAMEGIQETAARVEETARRLEDAMDLMDVAESEDAAQLEELLVQIFREADVNGDGRLDVSEFRKVMATAELELSDSEVEQMLYQTDLNADGTIEYAEFVPLACDVIQTMRARKIHMANMDAQETAAAVAAHQTLHGMSREQLNALLIGAFKSADVNGDGTLSKEEFTVCLSSLQLTNSKLTQREINAIWHHVDADRSGTIEYNEFVPLAFDILVSACQLAFLSQREASDLETYLKDVFASCDPQGRGVLTTQALKEALKSADLLSLSPVQILSVVSTAPARAAEDGTTKEVDYMLFSRTAADLIQKMIDPREEAKRSEVIQRASFTPLMALTEQQKVAVLKLIHATFEKYDTDLSGTLEIGEFRQCVMDSNLGFSDKQARYLLDAADADANGKVDYLEFEELAVGVLLQLAREDAIASANSERKLATVSHKLLENMFVLRCVFDAVAGSNALISRQELRAGLAVPAAEWKLSEADVEFVTNTLMAGDADGDEELSWDEFRAALEKAAGKPPAY